MKKTLKAESLIGIVVGIFILSFVLLGIGNLIGNSKQTINYFNTQLDIDILSKNASTIINNLDLSILEDGDIFYIYKNTTNDKFEIKIGEHNSKYKYINQSGNKIDNPENSNDKVYIRIFQARRILINNGDKKIAVKTLIRKLN